MVVYASYLQTVLYWLMVAPIKDAYFEDFGNFNNDTSFAQEYQLSTFTSGLKSYDVGGPISRSNYKTGSPIVVQYNTLGSLGYFKIPTTTSPLCSASDFASILIIDYSNDEGFGFDLLTCNHNNCGNLRCRFSVRLQFL